MFAGRWIREDDSALYRRKIAVEFSVVPTAAPGARHAFRFRSPAYCLWSARRRMHSPRQALLSIAVALIPPLADAFFVGVQVSSSRMSRSTGAPASPGDLRAVAKTEGGSAAAVTLPEEGSRGKLILGSKSFTRKMIVKEMGFAPVIRQAPEPFEELHTRVRWQISKTAVVAVIVWS